MTLERKLSTVFIFVFAVFVIAAGMTVWSGSELAKLDRARAQHYASLEILDAVLLGFDDAETGQRGFLLTGEESYLKPYFSALNDIEKAFKRLHEFFGSDREDILARLTELRKRKFSELDVTI